MEQLLGRSEDVADPHIPLLLWWAIEDKAISDRERVLGLVDSAAAWNRPITRAVVVERLARRYLAEGTPDGFATCARLLALAPTPTERGRLVRAMEQQMEGLHFDGPPAPLAAALAPSLSDERPEPGADPAVAPARDRGGLPARGGPRGRPAAAGAGAGRLHPHPGRAEAARRR